MERFITYVFFVMLAICAVSDWRYMIIPNWVVYGGMAFGIVGIAFNWVPNMDFRQSAMGAFLCGGGLFLTSFVVYRVKGEWALGMGDVKLVFMAGIYLGALPTFMGLFMAAFFGLFYSLWIYAREKKWREIPFGTFLAIGFVISSLFSENILRIYLSRIGL